MFFSAEKSNILPHLKVFKGKNIVKSREVMFLYTEITAPSRNCKVFKCINLRKISKIMFFYCQTLNEDYCKINISAHHFN